MATPIGLAEKSDRDIGPLGNTPGTHGPGKRTLTELTSASAPETPDHHAPLAKPGAAKGKEGAGDWAADASLMAAMGLGSSSVDGAQAAGAQDAGAQPAAAPAAGAQPAAVQIARLRGALEQAAPDPERLRALIGSTLQAATGSDPKIALAVLQVMRPYIAGHPELGGAIHEAASALRPVVTHVEEFGREPRTTFDRYRPARQAALRAELAKEDREYPNFRESKESTVSRVDVFNAISKKLRDSEKLPGASHALRVLMVGHSFGEQAGLHVLNFNYMGIELYRFERPTASNVLWTRGFRSDNQVTRAEFNANPDFFYDEVPASADGTSKGPLPKAPKPIEQQLASNAPLLFVFYPGPRAFYSSLPEATAAFIFEIQTRLDGFAASANLADQQVAAKARAGEVEAYIDLVHRDIPGKPNSAYNRSVEYPATIRPQLLAALADPALQALQ
jgi:hypothetical protein